jgi:hypothetical protein
MLQAPCQALLVQQVTLQILLQLAQRRRATGLDQGRQGAKLRNNRNVDVSRPLCGWTL